MIRRGVVALVICGLGLGACAAPAGQRQRECESALAELLARPELAGGRIGVCVVDAASGEQLLAAAADRGFATASNMKLLSGAVALQTLGPSYRFTTEIWQRGRLVDGELQGDLILRGRGDPTLDVAKAGAAADAIVAALQARGVRRIAGRIVGADGWLGTEHLGLGWQWDYLDEDYAAPFGGLCQSGNVVTITVQPGPDGPRVVLQPDVGPPPRIDVQQVPAAEGVVTRLAARRALGDDVIEVRGVVRADAAAWTTRVTVRDPAAFAARVLAAVVRRAGIAVEERADAPGGGDEVLLARVQSAPLADVVQHCLQQSDNLEAEQLMRVAAREAIGDGATAAIARHAAAVLAGFGVDTAAMVVADGSGLSRRNLVQPRQLVGVLAAAWRAPWRDAFVASLPLAGRTGTLRTRFRDGPASGRVRAKTGYISRVVCLSGYVPRPDPGAAPMLFSVMLNDFTCSDDAAKAAVDAFVQRLAASVGW